MTAADYLAMADDGRRYQLFDGELVEMTPGPSVRHQLIVMKLAAWLHGRACGGRRAVPARALPGARTRARRALQDATR